MQTQFWLVSISRTMKSEGVDFKRMETVEDVMVMGLMEL